MPRTPIQPLGAVAQAVRDDRAPDDASAAAPAVSDVPLAVRLDFAVLLTEAERAALQRPDSRFGSLPELPAMVYAAWRIRIDLHRSFDLSTADGYAGLWLWAIRDGRREIDALGAPIADARTSLAGAVERPDGGLPVSFPWIAAMLWCARPDLQEAYPLADARSAAGYLGWFLRNGVLELRGADLLPGDHVSLLAGPGSGDAPPPLVRYLEFIHAARPDIQSAFDIETFEGRRGFLKWFFDHGATEFATHPDILARQTQVVLDWGNALKQPGTEGPQDGPEPAAQG